MRHAALPALALALLLAGAPAAIAGPTTSEKGDDLEMRSDHARFVLQDRQPLLRVEDPANTSRHYQVDVRNLLEVPASGNRSAGESVATFDLTGADAVWNVTTTRDTAGVHVTLVRTGPVRLTQPEVPVPPPIGDLLPRGNVSTGNATVTLRFHLYEAQKTLGQGDTLLQVAQQAMHTELMVEQWPWVNEGDVLALEVFVRPPPREGDLNVNVTYPNATRPQRGVERMEVPGDGNDTLGWLAWPMVAQATVNGTSHRAPVVHARVAQTNDSAKVEGARHWLVYDVAGADTLHHDLVVAVQQAPGTPALPGGTPTGEARPTPLPGLALGALALTGVALALRRRRRA